MKTAFAGPWIGEFGWEIMTWIPYLRKLCREYDKMIISTFEGMEALYTGFHCELEFNPHNYMTRLDDWMNPDITFSLPLGIPIEAVRINPIKEYRIDGEYVRYGSPVVKDVSVLFHARGIEKGASKNWPREKWEKLAKEFPEAICIGSPKDLNVYEGMADWTLHQDARTADLNQLMDLIASASIVIGGSSGVMHLALMCGTRIATWGKCNNFGDTLENRYKETWNPFGTPVTWVGDTWNPEPEDILKALQPHNVPAPQTLSAVYDAVQSGQYIISTAFMGKRDGKEAVLTRCSATNFPDDRLDEAARKMSRDVDGSIAQVKAERIPVSWR
jgi:hypothetical protein